MEKKNIFTRKYAYFLVSIILVILIVAEVSQIETYHSSNGFEVADQAYANESVYIVVAKLPGVSVNAIIFLEGSIGNGKASVLAPENSSSASISLNNFNSSRYLPSIIVEFNSTSAGTGTIPASLKNNLNLSLSPSSPASVLIVASNGLGNISPAIIKTQSADYLFILASNVNSISYSEVSR